MKTYVYCAGPINGSGIQNRNVRRACLVAEELRRAGLIPFVPHLNVLWDTIAPEAMNEEWMEWDFAWLAKCDALYRLEGISPGSDREVQFARERLLPVYYESSDTIGMEALIAWARERERLS